MAETSEKTNPNEPELSSRVLSEPPQVKVITARWEGLRLAIASLVELVAAVVLTYALVEGKLSENGFMMLMGGIIAGPAIGKARGKLGITSAGLVLGTLGTKGTAGLASAGGAAAGVAKHLSTLLLAVLVALSASGCLSSSETRPDWSNVTDDANRLDTEINHVAEGLAPLAPLVDVGCALQGRESGDCHVLRQVWEGLRAGLATARAAVELYRRTGQAFGSAQAAVDRITLGLGLLAEQLDRVNALAAQEVPHARMAPDSGGEAARAPLRTLAAPAEAAPAEPAAAVGGCPSSAPAPAE